MRARIAAGLLLLTGVSLAACYSRPVRQEIVPTQSRTPARIEIDYREQLPAGWSVVYLQLYADGWLVWQGEPRPRSETLGPFLLPGTGSQEIYARALALGPEPHSGRLASARRVFDLGPGVGNLRVTIDHDLLTPGGVDVDLATR